MTYDESMFNFDFGNSSRRILDNNEMHRIVDEHSKASQERIVNYRPYFGGYIGADPSYMSGDPFDVISEPEERQPGQKLTNEEAVKCQLGLINLALSIMLAKRHDYGGSEDPFFNLRSSDFLGVHPVIGTLTRTMDKFMRIKTGLDKNLLVGEAAWEPTRDAVNYICIVAGLLAEQDDELREELMRNADELVDTVQEMLDLFE